MKPRGPLPAESLKRATDGLKQFQLDTVAAVVDAMFERNQRRFLVADEVGLGKTKVARATIAETIRRLWNDPSAQRINVIYICSNGQIARQNLQDLNVLAPDGKTVRSADRLTMLPSALAGLGHVNVVAFTPGTSFQLGRNPGRVGERAMLWKLLKDPHVDWGDLLARDRAKEIFSDRATADRFKRELAELGDFLPPRVVAKAFGKRVRMARLQQEFAYISDGRRPYDAKRGRTLISRLRRVLAEVCIELLNPDLIILDEFQRFSHLLQGEGEDGELARILLDHPNARVLLLSATPYKMLTRAEDEESHFEGFENTVNFLLGEGREAELKRLRESLAELRSGILGHRDPVRLSEARNTAQSVLRSVMVRTERLAAAPDRDGMLDLRPHDIKCTVTAADLGGFVAIDKAAQLLADVPSMIEYWKSAPYLFNFMDEYAAKRRIREELQENTELQRALRGNHMLSYKEINRYLQVDPRNGRLRWLFEDLDAASAFDVLWVPPALPQTQLAGRYAAAGALTKRLIFSSWSVVPKSVAALTSYEFERRHGRVPAGQTKRPRYSKVREGARPLDLTTLRGTAADNFTGWFALILPCRYLADLGDPLAVAQATGEPLPLSLTALRTYVTGQIELRLAPLLTGEPAVGAGRSIWYSAAQVWLDTEIAELTPEHWMGAGHDSQAFHDHWARLVEAAGMPETWGPRPVDLVERLADLAIAGPAIAALRAMTRQGHRFTAKVAAHELRAAAASVAWAFTSFFNAAEAHAMVESSAPDKLDYWKRLLLYCADGGLGSVLDEWFHLIPDQCRLNKASEDPIKQMAALAADVLRLNDGRSFSDFYDRIGASGETKSHAIRSHFAMRYGQARGATAEGENPVAVRNAFNSPFRPFVLVSTSVGQEGLDFHYYAHAIVHWNLPGNPVDLEQREGRVHRYKNHAVRKNVAARFCNDPALTTSPDPWRSLFELASAEQNGDGGLRPHWVYEGDARIRRLVPMLPLSQEIGKLNQLVEATSLYRMTMGQPRQAELMDVLAGLSKEEQDTLRSAASIDLKPRTGG
ncbi:helicase-related protein [Stenotrophomonas sp. PS02289]|uniref:helicase-related protein n=1 Tax=Stenotrophomonas sp. PS02289 TaxID=2991422 RepID=UPI00249AFC4B|nr:helicase-related protein [Stenotrophomonas sp. PS02289]